MEVWMSNDINVSGPVEITSDGDSRVALELMKTISMYENDQQKSSHRDYWLRLYRQCYKAAKGRDLGSILNTESGPLRL